MSEFKVRKRKDEHVLTVQGDITIQMASIFYKAINRLLSKDTPLVINIEKAKQIDLSGFQLICSAAKSSKKQPLVIHGEPEGLVQFAQQTGLYQDSKCMLKNNKKCIWVIGGTA